MALVRRLRRTLLGLFVGAIIAAPIIAWFAYPPFRVLIPALAPITCGETRVCVDDITQLPRAQAMYDAALEFVNETVGQIDVPPKMYFCATKKCSDHFGWDGVAGYNVGVWGAVIKPKGWHKYIVRHEMIHHLQNERFGMVDYVLNKPQWILEGMAYSLSEDPRSFGENLGGKRRKFEAWFAQTQRQDMWEKAAKLTR